MTTKSSSSSAASFTKQESVDKPGIIGAQWWQESIATQVPRRQAMVGLMALGGVLAGIAAIGTCAAVATSGSSSEPDVKFEARRALDMQKEYGWNFGARGDKLVFDGQSTRAFDPAALSRMPAELAPSDPRHQTFFVTTLFDSPPAYPKTKLADDGAPAFAPLRSVLVPISTPTMDVAFKQGQSLASLLANEPRAKDLAIVVDLPGPEAVAFAAGASSALDPVFLFDNWPHPRGVVPAHLTLAAAAYYQPMFATARTARKPGESRPMFVLDRKRLASYTDDASQFDNRHVARLPSAAALPQIGIRNVLYVTPNALERRESDDLVDDFLAYSPASITLHIVPATAFDGPAGGGTYYYGGAPSTHADFWKHWNAPPSDLSTNEVQVHTPTARVTQFSAGTSAPSASRQRPPGFGTVPVAIALGTGLILGAKLNRNGSWNRTSSTSSGS